MVYKIRKWIQSPSKQYQQYPLLEVCAVPPLISASETSKTFPPCTVLHSSVLYCIKRGGWKRKKIENYNKKKQRRQYYREEDEEKKNEKICRQSNRQAQNNQADKEFNHWGHSNPLWILGVAGQFRTSPPPKILHRKLRISMVIHLTEIWTGPTILILHECILMTTQRT